MRIFHPGTSQLQLFPSPVGLCSTLRRRSITSATIEGAVFDGCDGLRNLLVGGFDHLEKYESQWEGLSHIFMENKFETTHQQKNISVTQCHQDFDTELSAESSCVHTLFTVMSKTQCHYPLVNVYITMENHHV